MARLRVGAQHRSHDVACISRASASCVLLVDVRLLRPAPGLLTSAVTGPSAPGPGGTSPRRHLLDATSARTATARAHMPVIADAADAALSASAVDFTSRRTHRRPAAERSSLHRLPGWRQSDDHRALLLYGVVRVDHPRVFRRALLAGQTPRIQPRGPRLRPWPTVIIAGPFRCRGDSRAWAALRPAAAPRQAGTCSSASSPDAAAAFHQVPRPVHASRRACHDG